MSSSPSDQRGGLPLMLFYLAYPCMFLLLVLGPPYFGAWLYRPYDEALDWSGTGAGGMVGIAAGIMLVRCAPIGRGWRGALLGFAAAFSITALLVSNSVAVAVFLWALDPEALAGFSGSVMIFAPAVVLTLPVIRGAFRLVDRWQAADISWRQWFREWLRNENFRPRTGLGAFLGILLCTPSMLLAAGIEVSLFGAPRVFSVVGFVPAVALGLAIAFTIILTGPSDLRSTLRSVAASLVVFTTAIAAMITETAIALELGPDSLLLRCIRFLLVGPVFLGAIELIAHRPGGRVDEAAGG